MRPGGGKAKGASFERQICKDLSLWISRGEHPDVFWRSAMSGGRARVLMKEGLKASSQTGDLSSIKSMGEALTNAFIIECKFHRDLHLSNLITSKQEGLPKFWRQLCADCKTYGKKWPMLIAKQNRKPTLICLNPDGAALFFDLSHRLDRLKIKATIYNIASPMNIFFYRDFLKVNPDVIK